MEVQGVYRAYECQSFSCTELKKLKLLLTKAVEVQGVYRAYDTTRHYRDLRLRFSLALSLARSLTLH